jgi:hypothetical protein
MGLVEIATNQMNITMEIVSLAMALVITIVGAVYACWGYKRVSYTHRIDGRGCYLLCIKRPMSVLSIVCLLLF